MSTSSPPVYYSTSCFAAQPLSDIFALAASQGAAGIELGFFAGEYPPPESIRDLAMGCDIRLLVHNYFPPAASSFVLNLGSLESRQREASLGFAKHAIDLCRFFGAPYYSVHSAFACHASPNSLGKPLRSLPRYPLDKTVGHLVESLKILSEYASGQGVALALENHTVEADNLIDGENLLLPGATPEELLMLLAKVGDGNLGILLDLGHLAVSAASLHFSAREAVRTLAPHLLGLHVHDNDTLRDSHQPVSEKSWFWGVLDSCCPCHLARIVEVPHLGKEELRQQLAMLHRAGTK